VSANVSADNSACRSTCYLSFVAKKKGPTLPPVSLSFEDALKRILKAKPTRPKAAGKPRRQS